MKIRGTNFPAFGFKVNQKRYSYVDLIDRDGKDKFIVLLRLAHGYGESGFFYKPHRVLNTSMSRSTFIKYKDVDTYLHDNIKHYAIRSVFSKESEKAIKELK